MRAWFCGAGGSGHLEAWLKECSDYRLPSVLISVYPGLTK